MCERVRARKTEELKVNLGIGVHFVLQNRSSDYFSKQVVFCYSYRKDSSLDQSFLKQAYYGSLNNMHMSAYIKENKQ